MSFDHIVALVSAIIALVSAAASLAGIRLMLRQIRDGNRQRAAESLVEIFDINRQLIILGFSHPQVFDIMADKPNVDPVWEHRVLQMWLNQMWLIESYMYDSVFNRQIKDTLFRNISEFMTKKNMRRHWEKSHQDYPDSFQELVNGIIKKGEPPAGKAAHPAKTGHQHHDAKT